MKFLPVSRSTLTPLYLARMTIRAWPSLGETILKPETSKAVCLCITDRFEPVSECNYWRPSHGNPIWPVRNFRIWLYLSRANTIRRCQVYNSQHIPHAGTLISLPRRFMGGGTEGGGVGRGGGEGRCVRWEKMETLTPFSRVTESIDNSAVHGIELLLFWELLHYSANTLLMRSWPV